MQARAAEDLKRLVCQGLKDAGLEFESAEAFATPRRLALVVDGLPKQQPDQKIERKGPKADAPNQAIEGFLKAVDLTRDQVEERETPNGKVLFAVIDKKGQATINVLETIIPSAIESIPWPKSMRWSDFTYRYVRPLGNVLCLFDGEVVDQKIDMASGIFLFFTRSTSGHRFMAPETFTVKDFADYKAKLRKAKVVLDAAERRQVIEKEAARVSRQPPVWLE